MNDLNAKEVSDICVACGMCCDGTLFKKGTIKGLEDRLVVEDLGMEIIESDNLTSFKQPCFCFDKTCKIYQQTRPAVCNNFFCEPLKKYRSNKQSLTEAEKQIKTVLKLKIEMIEIANKFEIFNNLNWQQILLKLDEIIEGGKPSDLKLFGLMIIKLSFYKTSKKLLYSPVSKKEPII